MAGAWSVATTPDKAVLTLSPSVPVPPAARTGLTEEAEHLVRFIAPEAGRHDVRWAPGG